MEYRRLGRIGHETSVLVYGGAALWDTSQEIADASMQQALDAGINHFDTAASYGKSELLMGPMMSRVRGEIFLTSKTTERGADAAWRELNRSLELLQTDHLDLWQVHSVCNLATLDEVVAPGGVLEAVIRAKAEGLATWVGITGHGELAPAVHAEALRRYDFDSVLTPLNYHLYTADADFRARFDTLYEMIQARDVALRTIKGIARKPWDGDRALSTWYQPFTEAEDIRAAISWVLGSFPRISGLATAGETTLLGKAIAAEADRLSVEAAAAHLDAIPDYRSVFSDEHR